MKNALIWIVEVFFFVADAIVNEHEMMSSFFSLYISSVYCCYSFIYSICSTEICLDYMMLRTIAQYGAFSYVLFLCILFRCSFQLLLLLFLILPDLSHIVGFFSLWQIHIAQYNELLFVDGLPRDEYIRKWPSNIAYTVQYIFACWLRHSNHDAAQNNTNLAANTNTNHNLFSNSSAATKTRWNEQFFSHLTFH